LQTFFGADERQQVLLKEGTGFRIEAQAFGGHERNQFENETF